MSNLTKKQVTFITQVAQSVLASAYVSENVEPVARKLWASDVDPILVKLVVQNLASGTKPVVVVPKPSTKQSRPGWSRVTFDEAKAREYLKRIRMRFEKLCGYVTESAAHTDEVAKATKMLLKMSPAKAKRAYEDSVKQRAAK
jgi:hypothetical protein